MNRINKTSNEYVKVNNTNLFDKPNGVKLDTSGCKSY